MGINRLLSIGKPMKVVLGLRSLLVGLTGSRCTLLFGKPCGLTTACLRGYHSATTGLTYFKYGLVEASNVAR